MKTVSYFALLLIGVGGFFFSTQEANAALKPIFQEIGHISVSVDAEGNNNAGGGMIQIDKPNGATVRKAFLLASSYSGRVIVDGDVVLQGSPISWDLTETNGISSDSDFFNSTFADVTEVVRDDIDAAPSGISDLLVVEKNTQTIDGAILVVIFDDPNVTKDKSFILLFGAQSTNGDTFYVDFTKPLEAITEQIDMGLGIGYSYQSTTGTNQVNVIDVNDVRLTSSAGGEDDGGSYNGALITVGGIGDSNENPDPNDPSTGFESDDELYDLLPFINVGDKQVKVFSYNPSDDDNIFFSYFTLSEPAAILPTIEEPKERVVIGNLDPNLPTIVLTHGLQSEGAPVDELWTGTTDIQAIGLLRNKFEDQPSKVNIVQYVWREAFTPHGPDGLPDKSAYLNAQRNVQDAGARLAKVLKDALGSSYAKQIHFVGHSLGTAVNAYAAHHATELFLNVHKMQFSALDRPHHISGVDWPGVGIPGVKEEDEKNFGYDSNFFASLLPMDKQGLDLRVDNYYAIGGAGVGDRAEGNRVYNLELVEPNDIDDRIVDDNISSNNHSGVHQWYRWTMRPNDPFPNGDSVCAGAEFAEDRKPGSFDDTLNPCQKGWYWSVNNQDVLSSSTTWRWPGYNGKTVSVTTPDVVAITDIQKFGCEYTGSDTTTIITCKEQSSPYLLASIQIPEGAQYLSFDYLFPNPGDGDYAAVLIDNEPIWVMSGESAFSDDFVNSGSISVGGFEGERQLTVALYGVNEKGSEFQIKNFKIFSAEIVLDNTPPTTTLTTSGTGGPVWFRSDVGVTLTAEDGAEGTGVAKIEYSLDNGTTWQEYTAPFTLTSEGKHTVQYRSIDNAGNVEDTKTTELLVDLTAPEAKISADIVLKDLLVVGKDNLGSTTVAKTTTGYTITDQAGHVTKLVFKKTFANKMLTFAQLTGVQYDDAPLVKLPQSTFVYIWTSFKPQTVLTNQTVYVNKTFVVSATYLKSLNKTIVLVKENEKEKQKQTFPGLKLVTLTTNKGAVGYEL